jgi:hypothetical protein
LKALTFHENKTCRFDKPIMTFGSMVNARACKNFHTITTNGRKFMQGFQAIVTLKAINVTTPF